VPHPCCLYYNISQIFVVARCVGTDELKKIIVMQRRQAAATSNNYTQTSSSQQSSQIEDEGTSVGAIVADSDNRVVTSGLYVDERAPYEIDEMNALSVDLR
jgi:hypothetical protein